MGGYNEWLSEITIQKTRDTSTGTNYYFVRIPQTRPSGRKQYPFVICPNGATSATQSAIDICRNAGYYAVINAGVFNTSSNAIDGITIENKKIILNTPTSVHPTNPQAARPLTINSNGILSYTEYNADASVLVSDGVVSCISGFMPIVVDGIKKSDWINLWNNWASKDAQRQIIGQFENGDYAVVTIEGRGFDESTGMTVYQAADLCISLGLDFAYLLDGGGSTETVIGGEQLNTIYEGITGRKVPSFIVFTGNATFSQNNMYDFMMSNTQRLAGLSTDEKPTPQGNAVFLELDTGETYYYKNGVWDTIG
jgi:hypothetical protein